MYTVRLLPKALKSLHSIDAPYLALIKLRLSDLRAEPRPGGCKKLYTGEYRIRQGPYRILYTIDDRTKMIIVTGILPRSEAYK